MPDVMLTLGSSPDRSSPPHRGFPQPAANGSGGRGVGRERKTLTRADWIGTALDAMARDGLRAVAVEPLAERLGATKGSFYWHFRDRNALIEAAAEEWERTDTDVPLAQLDAIVDPRERYAATLRWLTGSERNTKIFLVVLWHADHPAIGPMVERVLAKRMAFSQRMREDAASGGRGDSTACGTGSDSDTVGTTTDDAFNSAFGDVSSMTAGTAAESTVDSVVGTEDGIEAGAGAGAGIKVDGGAGAVGGERAAAGEGQWAVVHAYSAWLGLQLLHRASPGLMPEGGVTEGFFQYAASFGGFLAPEAVDSTIQAS